MISDNAVMIAYLIGMFAVLAILFGLPMLSELYQSRAMLMLEHNRQLELLMKQKGDNDEYTNVDTEIDTI